MSGLALALALAAQTPLGPWAPAPAANAPAAWYGGRIVTTRSIHVGVRPALYLDNEGPGGSFERAAGLTLQVSAL